MRNKNQRVAGVPAGALPGRSDGARRAGREVSPSLFDSYHGCLSFFHHVPSQLCRQRGVLHISVFSSLSDWQFSWQKRCMPFSLSSVSLFFTLPLTLALFLALFFLSHLLGPDRFLAR